jgi:hypothetical protein
MSPRKLIPLVIVLIVLVVLVVLLGRKKEEPELSQEAGLTRLAPEGFLISDVDRLEVFLGSKQDESVRLEKDEAGWRVRSYFNAPGDGEKVSTLLETVRNLEGEFRSSEESVLEDFNLTEDQAVHLSVYKKGDEKPWLSLLVGKNLPNGGFVRRSGEETVYVIDHNLRRDFGLETDDSEARPEPLVWVKKTILEIKKEDVTRLAMAWPDREVVFEKKETSESVSDVRATEEDVEGSATPRWVAVGSTGAFSLKEKGVDQILQALEKLTAVDIVDPEEKGAKGLEDPPFRCLIGFIQGEEKTLIGSHPDLEQDGYMMVEGEGKTLFRISRGNFEGVFRKGADLFELPAFAVDEQSLQGMVLDRPDGSLVLSKTPEGDIFGLSKEPTPKRIRQDRAQEMWESLVRISPIDYVAHPQIGAEFDEPTHTATLVMATGNSHVIFFGKPSRNLAGRHMRIDADTQVFVLGKTDFDRVFPSLDEIFETEAATTGQE